MEQSYPAIPARYPPNCAGDVCRTYFATVRQEACRTNGSGSKYCDVIQWSIDLPQVQPELYLVRISLFWSDPKGNDMDLWVWQNDVEDSRTNCCLGPAYGSSTTRDKHPEVVILGEPPSEHQKKEGELAKYWLTIVNYSGFNSGYRVKLEYLEQAFFDKPFVRPEYGSGSGSGSAGTGSSGSGRPAGLGTGATDGEGQPESVDIIKVPGDDGTLTDQELSTLLAAEEERQTRLNPLIPATIGLLTLGFALAAFFFLWKRKRRLDEEALLP
ncbi:MAG: hypothetical protein KY429_01935 [Actinobacteria bacterium]|nr:hypothetical protein [Actinomycetota bacterium]